MLYVLILHFAAATAPPGVLYDSAAVIGPMDSTTCNQLVASNPTAAVAVSCTNASDRDYALRSYGCKRLAVVTHEGFTETGYTCE